MAVFGYGAWGGRVSSDVLDNYSPSHSLTLVAMVGVVVHLMLYIPNAFVITRLFLCASFGQNVLTLSTSAFAALTLILYSIPVALMASVREQDIRGVFAFTLSVTGDFPTGLSCFVLPAAIYLRVFQDSVSRMWYLAALLLLLGALVVVVSTTADVTKFVAACRSSGGCSTY
jgi:uncharacterized membrane protein